jgi:hypothetical protein
MIATLSSTNPKEPYNIIMEVTPDQAIQWLEGNTHNRPVNQAHVYRLAREIKAGRWRLTHQGIAFDTDGLLIDGQHRLWAVVEAKLPVVTRVYFNESPDNRLVLDSGQRRSNLDILLMTDRVTDVTDKHLATLRSLLTGSSTRSLRMTPGEEGDQYDLHKQAVEFAVRHLGTTSTKGLATATIRAVVARAFYSADHARLAHFCDVLKSGMSTGEMDASIILLRDYLIRTREAGRNESVRRLRYAKTQWALSAFLKGKTFNRLCSSDAEMFPLPEEVQAEAA